VNVVCIGGGISGHLVKLRIPKARVLDFRRSPTPMTRQFGGNYLWEPLPGVTCRSFQVITTVDGHPPDEEAVIRYKRKIGKGLDSNWTQQFRHQMVGYDIVDWPRKLDIDYGHIVKAIDPEKRFIHADGPAGPCHIPYDVLLSTVPLYGLVGMLPSSIRGPALAYAPIYVTTTSIPPDAPPTPEGAWLVNYISDPKVPAYRTTDRDGARHYESLVQTGVPTKRIAPGKVYPDPAATEFVNMLAHVFGIYCFGRFATWNPEELVHETDANIRAWQAGMRV
jgi:hypothetical protein